MNSFMGIYMKNSKIFLFLSMLIIGSSVHMLGLEIVKSQTHILKYPTFEGFVANFKKWGYPVAINGQKPEYHEYKSEKIVLYLYPGYQNYHDLTLKDYSKYKENNIAVLKQDCNFSTAKDLQAKYKNNSSLPFWMLYLRGGQVTFTYPIGITLITNTNKKIDFYVSSYLGCDAKYYSMTYLHPIAILIDENGYIVSILDDVKSEQAVFKAFGIK